MFPKPKEAPVATPSGLLYEKTGLRVSKPGFSQLLGALILAWRL